MPRWTDAVELVTQVAGTNAMLDPVMVDGDPREVFANKLSVRQSEFYQAAQTGLKPEIMFEVWTEDYQGEEKLLYNGITYTVIRTYDRPDEKSEIVCSRPVGK